MSRRVAVSEALSPVKQLLHREGFDVINLENEAALSEKGIGDYDAVIVSGLDPNMMGMQDISGKAVVISAAGRNPEEIVAELRHRLA